VRPLTKAPYVNGPDGFGSGQPDGMLAGMADGSVRFLARDIDPHVLEQLATIHGGNGAPLAGLARPSAATAPAAALTPPLKTAGPPDVRAPTASAALPETPALPGPVGPVAAHEPPEVDVATRLTGRIPALEVHNMALLNLVRLVGDLGGLAITLDMDACQWQGVNVLGPLSVRWEEATLRQVLDAVAAKCGLALLIQGNQVLLTSPREERETLRKVPYTVADLARDEAAGMAGLAALVRELVAPESWKPSGGRGTIAPVGDALVVEQTAAVHAQLLVFCEKLRRARGLALQSRGDPRRFELATRTDRVAVALDRVLSINFHQPAPLPRILAALEVATHAKILVDWVALRAAGLGPAAKVRVSLVEQPAAVVLADLLHPLGLDCYAIDAGLLGVTTRKAIAARWELEFYPVKDLLAAGWTASMLADQIKGSVAKASWNDVGGPGVIRLDEPSAHLIVVQTQPAQSAIARVLTELRRSPAKGQGT
jgi:hypothetical protein